MCAAPTALPKYVQIAEMLIRDIASGRLPDGSRLPPERDMAGDLGTAVGTLRKALCDLEDKGLLRRVHGSGNYVRYRPEAAGVYAFFRLELIGGGGLPTADVLDVRSLAPPDDLEAFADADVVHRIRRLRRLSRQAVALEEIVLDGRWAQSLKRSELSDSLYYFYRKRLGLWIASAEDCVGVGEVPAWRPDEFDPLPGMPCGHVDRIGRTAEGQIAEISRTWFDSSKARYVSRLR